MAASQGGIPIGRLGALLTLVGLVALPFVSCASVDLAGHELLRNTAPDVSEVPDAPGVDRNRERIFEGENLWLWFVYLGLAALAVVGLLIPDGVRLAIALGLLGVGGVVLFIERFEDMVFGDITKLGELGASAGFSWEAGAYLAVGGFVLVAVGGLRESG